MNGEERESMDSQLSDELQRFAAELRQLKPREDRFDQMRTAYLAGQASMVDRVKGSPTIVGIPLRSRAWPAAFAAMTALAAVLFVALIVRPGPPPNVESNIVDRASRNRSAFDLQPHGNPAVLSARDILRPDFEFEFAQRSQRQVESFERSPLGGREEETVLSPVLWQRIIGEPTGSVPTVPGAFQQHHVQGVQS
jgi:hypothetical protein